MKSIDVMFTSMIPAITSLDKIIRTTTIDLLKYDTIK